MGYEGMEWNGTGWNGSGWNRMAWDELKCYFERKTESAKKSRGGGITMNPQQKLPMYNSQITTATAYVKMNGSWIDF